MWSQFVHVACNISDARCFTHGQQAKSSSKTPKYAPMHSISLKDSQCTSLLDSVHLGDLNHYKDVICAGQNPGPHYFMPKVNNDLSKFNKI